jgi:tetratricopeptide (TPR) repeat protein
MKLGRSPFFVLIRLLALWALTLGGMAHADVYGDVGQLMRSGQLAEAEARADRHLKTKPRDPQMRYLKGLIQRDSGRQAEALETFSRLAEDYPELPEPYNGIAVIHAGQGNYDLARVALEKAIRANPAYATAHENLGDLHARLARQSYCSALQYDASNADLKARLIAQGISCP